MPAPGRWFAQSGKLLTSSLTFPGELGSMMNATGPDGHGHAQKTEPAAPGKTALGKTALIVGPDIEVQSQVQRVLPDWQIVCAADNPAALEMLKGWPFDLVLTGEETSGKDDLTLLRQIRLIRPHTRLIIFTSESTPEDVIAAMRGHAFSYFSKPFSTTTLAEMLRMATTTPVWDDGIEILAATPEWIQLCARCDLDTAGRLLQFIHEILDLPHREKIAIGTAFRELLMNAIEHGAHFDSTQHVEISYVRTRHMVLCRLKDPGVGFALEELRHTARSNPPDDPVKHLDERAAQGLRPGGFGILLAKRIVDDLIYGEKGNEVLLVKYLKDEDLADA